MLTIRSCPIETEYGLFLMEALYMRVIFGVERWTMVYVFMSSYQYNLEVNYLSEQLVSKESKNVGRYKFNINGNSKVSECVPEPIHYLMMKTLLIARDRRRRRKTRAFLPEKRLIKRQ